MILAVGCVTPLGDDPAAVLARMRSGDRGVRRSAVLAELPDDRAGIVDGPDLGPWLKRRKDIRLLPRAAQLALPAAGMALAAFDGDRESLALFCAVGREPPDEGDAEPALAAMEAGGALDPGRLGEALALYPPLLPLRTLPNMVLAHVAIQQGIRGENGVLAGGPEAGAQALAAGLRCIAEGRATYALVGAAYSGVDFASARDRWRAEPHPRPPGEAAIFVLLGRGGRPIPEPEPVPDAAFGDCGPVEGLWHLLGG